MNVRWSSSGNEEASYCEATCHHRWVTGCAEGMVVRWNCSSQNPHRAQHQSHGTTVRWFSCHFWGGIISFMGKYRRKRGVYKQKANFLHKQSHFTTKNHPKNNISKPKIFTSANHFPQKPLQFRNLYHMQTFSNKT